MTHGQTDEQTDDQVEVRDNPERRRFEIWVNGEFAGLTKYRPRDGAAWVFPHTEIEEAFNGRGLATILIRGALDEIRSRGIEVLPECPFVAGFIRKRPEYLDLVPADRRADFDLRAA